MEEEARPGRWHGTLVVRWVGGGGGGPRPQAEPGWRYMSFIMVISYY